MTNNQSNELRETLAKNGLPHNNVEGDLLIEIIETYCQDRERLARIDELQRLLNSGQQVGVSTSVDAKVIVNRLAQLKGGKS